MDKGLFVTNGVLFTTSLAASPDLRFPVTLLRHFSYRREDGTLNLVNNDTQMVNASLSKNVVPMMSVTNFTSSHAGSNLPSTVSSN
ncbi:hypothetical protein [Heyndrickxia shackletonii]|uniref:hypothetical protein n=1 Tax=Heyndrickxia shackletonii TaxID=157838 RepID=UPI0016001100|nr:hypothetical protein [Heyndrickxia shackletonii]MBB2482529.1 hypothetical protein [Bacillus sp. APMAM]